MKLYDFAFSPNCRKVRSVAYELGVPLDIQTVDLLRRENLAPAFLAKNPNGRAPLLEDGDLLLWESNAIISYLAAKTPSPSLLPTAPRDRAEVDRWLSWQLAHLGPAITKVAFERIVKKLRGQGAPDDALIAQGTEDFAKNSAVLEQCLGEKEYVAGRLSVADFALASHYSVAASAGLDVTPHRRVNAWLGRMLGRDSMKRALADAHRAMQ
jgi:glutathione S-transferase